MQAQRIMSDLVSKVETTQGVEVDFVGGGKKRVVITGAKGEKKEIEYKGKPTLAVLGCVLDAIGVPEANRKELEKNLPYSGS